MFEVDAAYVIADGGALQFSPEAIAPDDHDDFVKFRVHFRVLAIYPAEPDVGVDWDWNGEVERIEMRIVGDRFRSRYRKLAGEEFEAARAFLEEHHGAEMWDAGAEFASRAMYGEAA